MTGKRRYGVLFSAMFLLILLGIAGCGTDTTSELPTGNITQRSISTEELAERLEAEDLAIVDVRSSEAYLGWPQEGVAESGHIQGAVDFPLTWLELGTDEELATILSNKGVTKDKTVIVYGSNESEAQAGSDFLARLGYTDVLVYEHGVADWADQDLPMTKLAKYDKLVYPEWVAQLINGENPATYPGHGYLIFEVSWGEPKEYNEGHIPGAIHLDTNEIEAEPLWNRVSDAALEDMLLRHGVTSDTTVILYGADTTAAARAASIFLYAGVEDVRLLNGGFDAWKTAGLEIETQVNKATPVPEFGSIVPAHPEYIIDLAGAKEILADDNSKLVAVRSWAEYIGETSGYTYIQPKGRIPGDVWGHSGSDAYHMEDYRNIDNTMRNPEEIAAMWEEWGISAEQNRVAFYCGTGWRASEAFFDAYLMGWTNVSVFDGGWYEWSMDPANPVVTGEPVQK